MVDISVKVLLLFWVNISLIVNAERYQIITKNEYETIYSTSLNSCKYYKSPLNSQITCGRICNGEALCLFYVFSSSECYLCLLETPVTVTNLVSWTYNFTTAIVHKRCVIPGSSFGKTSTISYAVYSRSQWPIHEGAQGGGYIIKYTITLKARTKAADGILFLVDEHTSSHDFIAIYFKNGKVGHGINNGQGKGIVLTSNTYNDGMWHSIKCVKNGDNLALYVDNEVKSGKSGQTSGLAHVKSTYHFGGIPSSLQSKANSYVGVTSGFNGCIIDLKVNGQPAGEPFEKYNTDNCVDC